MSTRRRDAMFKVYFVLAASIGHEIAHAVDMGRLPPRRVFSMPLGSQTFSEDPQAVCSVCRWGIKNSPKMDSTGNLPCLVAWSPEKCRSRTLLDGRHLH